MARTLSAGPDWRIRTGGLKTYGIGISRQFTAEALPNLLLVPVHAQNAGEGFKGFGAQSLAMQLFKTLQILDFFYRVSKDLHRALVKPRFEHSNEVLGRDLSSDLFSTLLDSSLIMLFSLCLIKINRSSQGIESDFWHKEDWKAGRREV